MTEMSDIEVDPMETSVLNVVDSVSTLLLQPSTIVFFLYQFASPFLLKIPLVLGELTQVLLGDACGV